MTEADALLFASYVFAATMAVTILVTVLTLYYQARSLELIASYKSKKVANEIRRILKYALIPIMVLWLIVAVWVGYIAVNLHTTPVAPTDNISHVTDNVS